MRYHFTPVMMAVIKKVRDVREKRNAGDDVEKRESLYTGAGNVNWNSHYEKQYRSL